VKPALLLALLLWQATPNSYPLLLIRNTCATSGCHRRWRSGQAVPS